MLISFALMPISYRGYVYTSLDSKHVYYYLGLRFYSPLLSRFMNADSITDTGTGVVGTNMFAYCNNSPVVCVDPEGTVELATIAGVLGISVAELISGAFMLIFAVAIISNGDVIISFSEAIICIAEDKLNAVKNKLATLAYSEVVALSVSISSIKTKTKIKNEKKRYDYWIAEYKDYGDEMGVFYATYGISFDTAKSVVKSGKSVFASSRDKAKKLARAIGKYKPRHDSPHSHVDYGSLGYWPHYHAMANKNTSIGGTYFMSKTLINLNYDYLIQNEYDVIDYAMKHSDTFSVCVIKKKPYSARPPVFDFSEYIVPYAVDYIFEKSSRPVKFLGGNDPMIICKVDRNSRRSLHELLGWFEPIEKNMPSDICFYRRGRVWFATISHERMAQIYEPTDEDIKFFKNYGNPIVFK